MNTMACPFGSGSHPSGEANKLSSSQSDFNPSRKERQIYGPNFMQIYVACHGDRDILASLYEAWAKLPVCSMLSVVCGAIQEIQALREQVAAQGIEAEGQDPQGLGAKYESPVAAGDAP